MRYVRTWMGVGVLVVCAGIATAQPGAFSGMGPIAPSGPGAFGTGVPAPLPDTLPAIPQSGVHPALPQAGQPPVRTFAVTAPPAGAGTEEHSRVKDLTPHGGFGDIHPPENKHHGHHEVPGYLTPVVPSHGGFYAGAEFLLMRPRNSDLDFMIRSGNGLATTGAIDSVKYDIGTGLRTEFGYVADGGKWDGTFAFTYFTGGSENTINAVPNSTILPTLTRPGLTDRALTASNNLDLDYGLFDILMGRRFVIEDNLALRGIAGFRFADIRQTLNVFYDGADARSAAVRTRSKFQGFGPLVGGEATLSGERGFHLYGRALGGFMSGNSANSLIETNDNGATTYVNTRNDVRKVVPFGSVAIGGGWQYRSIAIRAGYEVQYWQGIFDRPRFVDDVGQGKVITRPANLSLEGLFMQVSVIY